MRITKYEKIYIGDGVYASFDGCMICLTTMRDGHEETIYLESNVFASLKEYGDSAFKVKKPETDDTCE